jgi:hypothetical protein
MSFFLTLYFLGLDVWTLLMSQPGTCKTQRYQGNLPSEASECTIGSANKEESYVWAYSTYYVYVKVQYCKEN